MTAMLDHTRMLPVDQAGATSFNEASARTRIELLLDAGSFVEFIGPEQREVSPHLKIFDIPEQLDDGIVVGRGRLDATRVLIAAQEGRFMGGAFGEVHGAKLTGLLRAAREIGSMPVLILFDTGGVRLQEANAGELAIAEIMRAVIEARVARRESDWPDRRSIRVLWRRWIGCGLLLGPGGVRAGPNRGVRPGGHRNQSRRRGIRLPRPRSGLAHYGVASTAGCSAPQTYSATTTCRDFRNAALELVGLVGAFDLDKLKAEQARLADRLQSFGNCKDAVDIWGGRRHNARRVDPPICPPTSSFLSPTRSGGLAVTLDDILASLFPQGHAVKSDSGIIFGSATLRSGVKTLVIGVADRNRPWR